MAALTVAQMAALTVAQMAALTVAQMAALTVAAMKASAQPAGMPPLVIQLYGTKSVTRTAQSKMAWAMAAPVVATVDSSNRVRIRLRTLTLVA